MTTVIITTLAVAALLAALPFVLLDVAVARPAAPVAPEPVNTLTTVMHGLPPNPLPDVPHRHDQPPSVLIWHSSNSGWHCVCNGTHDHRGCWCSTLTGAPVIPGRSS